MTSASFHLITLTEGTTPETFLSALRALPEAQRPQWVANTHHWLHEPHLDVESLLGPSSEVVTKWQYLLITAANDLPAEAEKLVGKKWSIQTVAPDFHPGPRATMEQVQSSEGPPPLPAGWSTEDPSGIVAHVAPKGLNFTLAEPSRPLGSPKSTARVLARDYVRTFGDEPFAMFNLLSYLPGKRQVYQEGYVGGFIEKLGPKFGGWPLQFGPVVEEGGRQGEWEDVALVWYPSLWHFAKMIDDEAYMELDRKFKPASLRDNPLLVTTEVKL